MVVRVFEQSSLCVEKKIIPFQKDVSKVRVWQLCEWRQPDISVGCIYCMRIDKSTRQNETDNENDNEKRLHKL